MSREGARTLLHLARGQLPPAAVGDGDVVVYAQEEESGWRLGSLDGEAIDEARIIDLLFEVDVVAVW